MKLTVFNADAYGSPPALPAITSEGYPTDGDPVNDIPATEAGAYWYYQLIKEYENLFAAAGVTPDEEDLSQLLTVITKLVSASNHVVRLEDVTFGPSVSDGDAVYWDNSNSRYDRAIADGTDKQKMVGFADVTNSLVEAFGRSALFSGLTAGARYYLSDSTAGAITSTAPSEKVAVGLAKSATVMFVDIDPTGNTAVQDQSTWNTGTDTTESLISPDKLDKKIKTRALGEEQSWQNMTASRTFDVVYTNPESRSIEVAIMMGWLTNSNFSLVIDGIELNGRPGNTSGGQTLAFIQFSATIPPGSTYELKSNAGSPLNTVWMELR